MIRTHQALAILHRLLPPRSEQTPAAGAQWLHPPRSPAGRSGRRPAGLGRFIHASDQHRIRYRYQAPLVVPKAPAQPAFLEPSTLQQGCDQGPGFDADHLKPWSTVIHHHPWLVARVAISAATTGAAASLDQAETAVKPVAPQACRGTASDHPGTDDGDMAHG